MDVNANLNLNSQTLKECLQETHGWSETIVTNICNGSVHHVPNGFWDYAGNLLLAGVGASIALVLLGLALGAVFSAFDY